MENNVRDDLKGKFRTLINNVPQKKQMDLLNELTVMRKYLDKYDFFFTNWVQGIGIFLSKNIIEKVHKTVDDILDNFNNYTPEDQNKVKVFFTDLSTKYVADRTLLDKILSVLRNS